MVGHLLDRIVCQDNGSDFWTKVLPLIIFGVIWLFGAIAKAVQSKTGKKENQPQPMPRGRQDKPELENFVKMVKDRYAEAREQARKAAQREYVERTVSHALPAAQPQVAQPAYRPVEPEIAPEPAGESMMPQVSETTRPTLKAEQRVFGEERPAEMTALDQQIYEPSHKPYLPELLEQLAKPDGLRKAFLYSEIFGKPVGQREN